jgi:hypothetical protein
MHVNMLLTSMGWTEKSHTRVGLLTVTVRVYLEEL